MRLKTKATVVFILALSTNMLLAQQTKIFNQNASRSNHTRHGLSAPLISLSGGVTNANNNFLKNGLNLQADAFVPFYSNDNNFAIGLNIAANYAGVKNAWPDNNATANQYQVYSATNSVATEKSGASSGNLSGLAGIQALFVPGRLYISPLLSAGYSHVTLQGFSQYGTYSANGQKQQTGLVKREEQSFNGLIFKPQVRVGFSLTSSLSIFANTAYAMGPTIKPTTNYWVPQGGFNDNHTYEPQQMQNGSWTATSSSNKYKAWEGNLGLTIALGKKKNPASSGIGGMSKPGGAVSSSYARTLPGSDGNNNGSGDSSQLKTQGINNNNGMPNRLSMTPTTARQTQGNTFGEKVAGGLQAAAMARPGSPIGGIVVKGGKNPGGNTLNLVTDENGEVIFTAPEAGEYKLQFAAPQPDGKSISEQGVKESTPTKSKRKGRRVEVLKSNKAEDPNAMAENSGGRTYTGGRKNEIPTSNITAGSPIGGIVVKGGKNPSPGNGWGAINVVSDDNGEVIFSVKEPGEYKLQLTAPEAPGKSISEKGVSAPKPKGN